MKRPLGFVALVYGLGLITGDLVQVPLWIHFTVSLFTATLALSVPRARPHILVLLVFLTGWTNFSRSTSIISPHDLRRLLDQHAEEVTIRGQLAHAPSERVRLRDDIATTRTLAEIAVFEIHRNGRWMPATGHVLATVPSTLEHIRHSGQPVEVSGLVAPPTRPVAWGLFDYPAYLRRQGIHYQLSTKASDWKSLSSDGTVPLSKRFNRWGETTLARGLPEVDRSAKLLWAMTLGSRDVLPPETYESFVQSGTMHLFAISGLHMGLIASIVVSLCRVCRVPRHWCGVIVIPLLWFYTGATGWTASAVRSSVMMSIVVGGWSLRRPVDLMNSLAAAALIILVADPQQLFQAGFQLSFLVVLSIAVFLPRFEAAFSRVMQWDPWIPRQALPRWKQWLESPLRHVMTGLMTSLAAWIGALPVTAYYFNLFSPITLIANVVMVPLGSAALACGLGSLASAPVNSGISELFNHSAWLWMELMTRTGEAAARVPWAYVYVPRPSLLDLSIYYALTGVVVCGWMLRSSIFRRGVPVSSLVIAFYAFRVWESQVTTEILVIPCSGGTAIYMDAPGRRDDLLFDCGNAASYRYVVEPFLRSRGVSSLSRVALSHGDARAMGGAPQLLERVGADQVFTSSARFRSGPYRAFIDSLPASLGSRWRQVESGNQEGNFVVLFPPEKHRANLADDACLVLKINAQGHRVLLLSELGREGQEQLLSSGLDLKADIVIAGIPERTEPLRQELLAAIAPSLIVITDAELPASKRAKPALRERLNQYGVPVVFLRDAGAIRLQLEKRRWRTETMLQ